MLESHTNAMTCVSQKEKLSIHGDNNTLLSRAIFVTLKRCKEDCKSEEEFDKFMEENNKILFLTNEIKFNSTNYGTDSIVG